MNRIRKSSSRLKNFLLILVIVTGQVATATGPFLSLQKASAAPICVNDSAGANDEPGQKDLTKLCVDYAGAPTNVSTTWNWDELGTSGSNTLDACNLFDTDGDGNINNAVCVTTTGNPATLQSVTTYSCGDTKIDRCTSTATIISSTGTSCTVTQQPTDPFPTGDSFNEDTQGACNILLSTVGGSSAKLIDVCSYPSAQPNSDPSDCVIARNDFGKVELKKDLVPNSDTGKFNLTVNGPEASDTTTVNNVGDSGTTGELVVKKGSVVVSETAGTSTSLANYNTTIECRDLNGTGTPPLTTTSVNLTDATTRQATFTLVEDADVICVITNTRQQASLILQKTVMNDNGGTLTQSSFPVAIGGATAQWGSNTVSPGTYTVSETQQSGYQASVWSGDCDANGNVTLTDNQTKTCSITNNDQPGQIRVIKSVTNDNGGNAVASDFQLNINGVAKNQNQYYSSNAGTYTVSENAVTGYAQTSIACRNDANQQVVAHPVTLALAQSVTCTVTNDDNAPQLKVVKNVTNDNGGTALPASFQLTVNGNNVSQNTSLAGINSNTSYAVSEVAKTGYAGTAVTCVDDTTQVIVSNSQSSSGNVSLNEGQQVTCTVYNDDIAPKLTVIKTVINNEGGTLTVSSFPLYVGTVQVVSGVQNNFNAGMYVVSETNQPGYTAGSWGTDCDLGGNITLAIGGVYTCTITNNDQPATIIVDKVVVNDDGGTASASDWTLKVNQTTVTDEATNTFNGNTLYTISEQNGPSGYTQTSLTCQDITDSQNLVNVTHPFTAQLGHTYRCTITNNDQPANLTLVKTVTKDNGGTATQNLWTLTANGPETLSGQDATESSTTGVSGQVNAGTYNLSESGGPSGYTPSAWNCTGTGFQQTVSSVALSLNANVTCTINNNDQPATLVLVKNLPNDNGGTASQNDFPVFITGQAASWGNNTVSAGSYVVSETTLPGYTPSAWSVNCDANGNVSLLPGETKTCTITNDDVAPSLTLNKIVSNTHGGSATESAWILTATGPTTLSGAGATGSTDVVSVSGFSAGTYTLSESTGPAGYSASAWTCTDNVTVNSNRQITLANGQTTVCSITNSDVAPTLTVTKVVLNPYGTPLAASAFPLFVDSTSVTSGAANTQFNAGTHTISETQQTGYTLTGLGGDCTQSEGIISVLLRLAGASTCTLTNTAIQPKLIVIKHVVNDNGGTKTAADFTMTVRNNSQSVNDFAGAESPGTNIGLNEGSYTVDELADAGYVKSFSDDCTGIISIGRTKTCTITNDDVAPVLTLNKIVVSTNEDHQASNWTLTATPTTGIAISGNGSVTQQAVANMTYTLSELNKSDGTFDASAWTCTDNVTVTDSQIVLSEGANVTCTITNTERATVVVTKYNDFNRDGNKDETEPTLEGWEMLLNNGNVGPVPRTTGTDGTTTFTNVAPNSSYGLSETQQPENGWNLSNIVCENVEGDINNAGDTYNFYIIPGQTVKCYVGNYREPVLLLSKTNNRPAPTSVGDTVTYTLVVTVPEDSGAVFDTSVQDLPPEGFNYVPGTWTATSSVRGNIIVNGPTTEPTYGSPGTWKLGTLLPGEVVTLSYKTLIASTASAGTYPDIAFASGCESPTERDCKLLANVQNEGDTPFVATQVTVRAPQVLGATTTVLVNTGASEIWRNMMVGTLLLGLALATIDRRNKKGYRL